MACYLQNFAFTIFAIVIGVATVTTKYLVLQAVDLDQQNLMRYYIPLAIISIAVTIIYKLYYSTVLRQQVYRLANCSETSVFTIIVIAAGATLALEPFLLQKLDLLDPRKRLESLFTIMLIAIAIVQIIPDNCKFPHRTLSRQQVNRRAEPIRWIRILRSP